MRRAGFTLTELMVALAIVAILLAAGLPNMSGMVARQQLRTAVNDLFSALNLTRSLAIARGERVIVMPSEPAGLDWSLGWVVFVDKNDNLSLDAGDELIFRQGPVGPGIAIRATLSSSHAPLYIAYNGAGRSCSAGNSTVARWGTLSLAMGRKLMRIKINMLGRARMCDPLLDPDNCAGAADG
ncbi:type IV fimbrial biogenesis protein FimT [Oxalobacteraceae bacterium GrIS 1.11]